MGGAKWGPLPLEVSFSLCNNSKGQPEKNLSFYEKDLGVEQWWHVTVARFSTLKISDFAVHRTITTFLNGSVCVCVCVCVCSWDFALPDCKNGCKFKVQF